MGHSISQVINKFVVDDLIDIETSHTTDQRSVIKELDKLNQDYVQNLDCTMSIIFSMFEAKITKIEILKIKNLFAKLRMDFTTIDSVFDLSLKNKCPKCQ
jgi:DNA-binding MarR family transcriptional regulator